MYENKNIKYNIKINITTTKMQASKQIIICRDLQKAIVYGPDLAQAFFISSH